MKTTELHQQLSKSYMYALGYNTTLELVNDGRLDAIRTPTLRTLIRQLLEQHKPFFAGVANALRELLRKRLVNQQNATPHREAIEVLLRWRDMRTADAQKGVLLQ